MTQPADLRAQAEGLGHALPALLAHAQHLAAQLPFGAHGRKRAGDGSEFWQYRPAVEGDAAQTIDWRRSARGDITFVRQREWQAQNAVALWVDGGLSMRYASVAGLPNKGDRARLLALALAVMLLRAGERVGLAGGLAAKTGRRALADLAAEMLAGDQTADHGNTPPDMHATAARHVYLSDFLGPLDGLKTAIARASDMGAQGLLIQTLDPAEQNFPFAGRTLFLSMSGQARFDTQSAADLRGDYLQRLAERKDALAALARGYGWDFHIHHSDKPPLGALIWAHQALSRQGANL